ncbi:hypothetical protein [Ruminococcus sp.]|uniref:hypothetical protein n=1 Tax=Ruminococcus sp. TaxID=41978 RepID=UPI0026014F56|nr:hypothetical protein [Ruminococcus sp.]MBQ6252946.1 hypothetical protein [Ruminococcus sp.]
MEKVKEYSFPNGYEADYYTPYIREYSRGFRNSFGKDKSRYTRLNVHNAGDFMYSGF